MKATRTRILIEWSVWVIALCVLAWFASASSDRDERALQTARWLGQADQLAVQLDLLDQKSMNYLSEAPRNYEDFFRDTKIAHQNLLLELATLDSAMQRLVAAGNDSVAVPAQRREQIDSQWKAFRQKLDEQLGVDPEVPRLEWGFRHIDENSATIIALLDETTSSLEGELNDSTSFAVPVWFLPLLLLWIIGCSVWLAFRARK